MTASGTSRRCARYNLSAGVGGEADRAHDDAHCRQRERHARLLPAHGSLCLLAAAVQLRQAALRLSRGCEETMNGKQQGALRQSQSAPDVDETIVSLDPANGISDQAQAAPAPAALLAKRRRLLGCGGRPRLVAVDRSDPAADPPQPRRLLRHEHLEPGDLRRAGEARRRPPSFSCR